jgi:type VI secretion system protein ImpA
MGLLDVEQLLEPIAPDSPCGENLEYDADFGEMERAAQGAPEQQFGNTVVEARGPDWREVRSKALDLLARTKDIRIAVYLARACAWLDGLPGFCEALAYLQQLLGRYWQEIHPQLDPDDHLDPTLRVNALLALCDSDACLRAVLESPIVESAGLGKFCYRDYLVATGEMPPRTGETAPETSTIESAFLDANADQLLQMSSAMACAVTDASGLELCVTDHVGSQNSASFEPLIELLKKIWRLLSEQVDRRGLGVPIEEPIAELQAESGGTSSDESPAMSDEEPVVDLSPPPGLHEVHSRDDVIRLLDKICDYYRDHEPSSPVPLLLRRAKRIVTMDFLELLRELVPSGLSEAELLGGAASSSSSDGEN